MDEEAGAPEGPPTWTLALRLAYDGRRFDAYARNPTIRTVENCLLTALRHEGYVEESIKSGSRTDAGVSALENVLRVRVVRKHLRGLIPAVQKRLPDGMWLTGVAAVGETWNPRHAHTRTYLYHAVPRDEDLATMQAACSAFLGTHHMGAFAKMEEGRNPNRTIRDFSVERLGDLWRFRVVSDGYLWNQVRRMVGAVVAVGRGEANPDDVKDSLASGLPHKRFKLAAPDGLLLESVQYDGLVWAEEAGMVAPHKVPFIVQQAAVGDRLAHHLWSLAPWPKDEEE